MNIVPVVLFYEKAASGLPARQPRRHPTPTLARADEVRLAERVLAILIGQTPKTSISQKSGFVA